MIYIELTSGLQGYEADNPNIELLRLRNFTIGKAIPDEVITGEQGLKAILDLIGVMVPFVSPPVASNSPPPGTRRMPSRGTTV